jgi:hypothetical protein
VNQTSQPISSAKRGLNRSEDEEEDGDYHKKIKFLGEEQEEVGVEVEMSV